MEEDQGHCSFITSLMFTQSIFLCFYVGLALPCASIMDFNFWPKHIVFSFCLLSLLCVDAIQFLDIKETSSKMEKILLRLMLPFPFFN